MEYEINLVPLTAVASRPNVLGDCEYCVFNHALKKKSGGHCAISDEQRVFNCIEFNGHSFENRVFVLQHTLTKQIVQPESVVQYYKGGDTYGTLN